MCSFNVAHLSCLWSAFQQSGRKHESTSLYERGQIGERGRKEETERENEKKREEVKEKDGRKRETGEEKKDRDRNVKQESLLSFTMSIPRLISELC